MLDKKDEQGSGEAIWLDIVVAALPGRMRFRSLDIAASQTRRRTEVWSTNIDRQCRDQSHAVLLQGSQWRIGTSAKMRKNISCGHAFARVTMDGLPVFPMAILRRITVLLRYSLQNLKVMAIRPVNPLQVSKRWKGFIIKERQLRPYFSMEAVGF